MEGLEGTSYYRILSIYFFSPTPLHASQSPPTFNLAGSLSRLYKRRPTSPHCIKRHFASFVSSPAQRLPQLTLSFFSPAAAAAAAPHFFILQQYGWTCPSFKFQKFVSILPKSCLRWLAHSSS